MNAVLAPHIRARSKTRNHEPDEARALKTAAWIWRSTPVWIPVAYGRRVVAWVRGDPDRGCTLVSLGQGQPYADQDAMVAALSGGKHYGPIYWWKPVSTSIVIDNWYDLWGCDGYPVKGNWSGTARTARQFTGSTSGGMQNGGAVSPGLKYLTRASHFSMEGTTGATLLYDRVLSYDACTMTAGSQNMTNTLPATRYNNNGDPGLQIFVEADSVHNATAANLTTLTYQNSGGTAGHTVLTTPTLTKIPSVAAPTATLGARNVFEIPGSATKSLLYLNLQAGDVGVQSITNYTWSAAPTGTCSFVLQFPLCLFIDQVQAVQSSDYEFIYGHESVNKRIFDDACLSWMVCPHVTGQPSQLHGVLEFGST